MQLFPLPVACRDMQNRAVLFDMDGTLLEGDLGETFFYFRLLRISGCLAPQPADWKVAPGQEFHLSEDASAALSAYHKLEASGDDAESFLQAFGVIADDTPEQMRAFAGSLVDANLPVVQVRLIASEREGPAAHPVRFSARLRPGMKALASRLQHCGAVLWIITGTLQYLSEGLADRLSIPHKHVLAALVDLNPVRLVRYPLNEGKVLAMLEAGVSRPLLAFGDSMGDAEMLAQAQYPVVLADAAPGLLELAVERNWIILDPGEMQG